MEIIMLYMLLVLNLVHHKPFERALNTCSGGRLFGLTCHAISIMGNKEVYYCPSDQAVSFKRTNQSINQSINYKTIAMMHPSESYRCLFVMLWGVAVVSADYIIIGILYFNYWNSASWPSFINPD
jgi:hypothetical protein